MLMIAAVLFGFVAFERLPINLLPDISYPTFTIRTEYAGTAPGEVENLLSEPVEDAVGVISGVVRTSSISRPGISDVILEFDWKTNMDFASLEVREKLDVLTLPRDADPPVLLRFDPSLDPIMRIALAGDESLIALRLLAEERLRQELESIDGVASIQVSGGLEEEIQINVDEGRLAALGIPITQVSQRMAQENVNLTGGTLKDGDAEFLVRTLNEFKTVDEMRDIIVGMRENAPIMLRDVAEVRKGFKERKVITHLNREESVELAVYKEADQNTVTVAKAVKERLQLIMTEFEQFDVPLKIDIVNDQSLFIENSVDEVLNTAIWGGVLAVMVLFLFLRNVRSTIIISLAIPISIMVTFFFMYLANVSLNIMSLGGLALGVGMLVDNAIVVLESIDRYRRENMPLAEAADKGTGEVGQAVVASTLTTVCVFVPIIFVEGISGQLFKDQALTVTFALVASLLVALTLIPMLASRKFQPENYSGLAGKDNVLKKTSKTTSILQKIFVDAPVGILKGVGRIVAAAGGLVNRLLTPIFKLFDRSLETLTALYPQLLDRVLNNRLKFIGITLLLFIISVAMVPFIGTELIPEMSQGEFYVDTLLPIGTPVEETDATLDKMASLATGIAGVESVYAISGTAAQMGFSATELRENLGQLHIRLEKGIDRPGELEVMEGLRRQFHLLSSSRLQDSTADII